MINIEWIQRLESQRFNLTKREEAIVSYLEEHFDDLPHISVKDVVEATGTSRSTVHRLCDKMGYDGFKAFKQAMAEYKQSLRTGEADFTPRMLTPKIAAADAMRQAQSPYELFQKGFEVDMQALQRSMTKFPKEQITRIVQLILQANTLYCLGYQSGQFPAEFLGERLSRLRCKVQLIGGERRRIKDMISSIDKDDLLLLFEYHKDFTLDRRLLEFAHERGAKVIAMTDYPTSPVVSAADETLIVHRGLPGFQNSMALPMTVVNNLLLAVEYELGDKRDDYLQEWDEFEL